MFSDCTNLSTIKSKKILDISTAKCYTNIVKEMRLQVDSPMLAKGSNPVMDASKNLLDKNIKKHKKGIDTINKMCYNIIVKRIEGNHQGRAK